MPINLADRIKELSYTIGTGNITLSGPVRGFSSFSSVYSHSAEIFYAITDGTNYEIGSGIYQRADYDGADGITVNQLIRFPIKSTNGNAKVNFAEGIKEVYVTYPATHSVYTGSGLAGLTVPQSSGLAFWGSDHILDYDSNFVWDKTNNRLGINKTNPSYTIDIGGGASDSIIRTSGLIVSSSGIYFPSGNNGDVSYSGGRQLTHYIRNETDKYAYDRSLISSLTGSNAVIELSGSANQYILFKQQQAGLVFAGPSGGCSPPCAPGYPSFRPLSSEDMPFLDDIYVSIEKLILVSGILNTKIDSTSGVLDNRIIAVSGILNTKIDSVSGVLNNRISAVSGILRNDLITVSGMCVSSSGTLRNDLIIVSGIASSSSDSANIIIVSGMCVSSSGTLRNDLTTASGTLRNDLTTASGALRSNDTAISGYFQSKTQNIIEYSPTGMRLAGNVGINYPLRTDCSLSSRTSAYNKPEIYGSISDALHFVNTNDNAERTTVGSYIISRPIVQNQVYNSGISIGSIIINHRNNSDPNDNGTLENLYGLNVTYGNSKAFPQSPTTNSAVGLSVSCYALSGIIDKAYDIVLARSGESVNEHWGIFQISPNNNYFAGNIGLDTQYPTASLDIQSDIIRLRTPKTPASGNAPCNVGDICWDNSYMYICVSNNSWKRSAISAW